MDGLEALAQELRSSRETLDGGTWLLSSFYDAAVLVPRGDVAAAREAMDFYTEWARVHPTNITAQVCLAYAYTHYAWNARGSGYSNTVSEEGWRLFSERLETAWEVLEAAEKLPQKCPGWVSVAQRVGLGQNWDRARYFKMVDEAVRQEPTFGSFYTKACYWLLPRWHGETGDFESWLAQLADGRPGKEGDLYYAHLVWMADRVGFREEIVFDQDRLDWVRTKRGFQAWLEEKPDNLMVRFEFLSLAMVANDLATARQQLDFLGGKYWPDMWENEEEYEKVRRAAYFGEANPLFSPPEKSHQKIDPATRARVAQWLKHFTGFAGGIWAGGLCWILAFQRKKALGGGLFFVAAVFGGTLFTTMELFFPVVLFVSYLLWHQPPSRIPIGDTSPEIPLPPPPLPESPGWTPGLTVLWVLVLSGAYLGLQTIAVAVTAIPLVITNSNLSHETSRLSTMLFESGQVYIIFANGAWLTGLLLLIICEAKKPVSLMAYLGLIPCPPLVLGMSILGGLLLGWGSSCLTGELGDERTNQAMEMMSLGVKRPFWFFVATLLAAPFIEELIFRGFGFRGLLKAWGFAVTAFITSTLFCLLHIQYGWSGLAQIFLLGMALSFVRFRTGSLWASIGLHVAFNAVAVFEIFWR
jgi:membrane protease YdiL (CAAX protease family)